MTDADAHPASDASNNPSGVKPLRFDPTAGPAIDPISIAADKAIVMGRSSQADRQLTDKTVSRRHCRVNRRGNQWFITDLGSRHGTYLNGIRLEPELPAPLSNGDLARLGPWTFRVLDGSGRTASMPTSNDLGTSAHRVQRVPQRELRSVAQQRLDLLIECAAGINSASSMDELAHRVLDAVLRGAGFTRSAFIRPVSSGGDVEVVAYLGPENRESADDEAAMMPPDDFSFSRSLITAAASGEIVRMTGDAGGYGESIIQLGIHSALCAPIMLGESVEAFLYLDARDGESGVQADAAAFCQAISRLAGLALANLKRLDLEAQRRIIDGDLKAARQAQRLIMPPAMGQVSAYTYSMQTKPGREVAGDLFDILPIDDPDDAEGRVAVFLGDVTGKGVGAAILMATAQTHLRMGVRLSDDPATIVADANRYIAEHIGDGLFISLFFAILDPKAGLMRFVDAGHGHWLVKEPGAAPSTVESEGGLLMGVDRDFPYHTEERAFPKGSRLLMFSDGLLEQQNPDGKEMGLASVIAALSETKTPREDVVQMSKMVREYAETDVLADDLTIASVGFRSD